MIAIIINIKNRIYILKFLNQTFKWLQHQYDQIHSNDLLLDDGYDDLRSRMKGCGGAKKFWSFDPKLPNRPPYP